MIEIEDAPALVDPLVIAAFEGWNDAADAASGVVDHLMDVWQARIVGSIDPRTSTTSRSTDRWSAPTLMAFDT